MTADTGQDWASELRDGVRGAYSAIAANPEGGHPFPTGRCLALGVGYPEPLLESLPAAAVDAFAGVSNVSVFAAIPRRAVVLDLGCGAGMDSLIAAQRVGPGGTVIGVDFSEAMLQRSRTAVRDARARNVELRLGDAEHLPLASGSVDVALVNGIFNLNPARDQILRELARVLRSGGEVFAAELALVSPLSTEETSDAASWFS